MKKLKKLVICFLIIAMSAGMLYQAEQRKMQQDIARRILRFHVLANSDSQEDQNIKYKVRDKIVSDLQQMLIEAENLDEARKLVSSNMDSIVSEAEKVVKENGYTYEVSGKITNCDFPEKQYGDMVFPAGEYEALRIELGEAEGQNWWCVLFPSLCFVDSSYDVVSEDGKEALKENLTEEEYEAVTSHNGKVSIRFKLLQIFGK
ncbi:stage II sporulation protein R [Anaerolentibacter hominis]|uniref:stage II sporulation protein R n=1 Tax=Anaerolentibacter hominis TaxID=3079009 RepID=UPI0031B83D28